MDSLTSEDVRRHNLGLVAEALSTRSLSRSELADTTGLTRGAITSLTAELIEADIVREASVVAAPGRGRPKTLLELAADQVGIITATLEPHRAVATVAALNGERLELFDEPHDAPSGNASAALDALAAVVTASLDHAAAIGRPFADLSVVVPAPTSGTPRVMVSDPVRAWGTVDIVAELGERIPRLRGRELPLLSAAAVAGVEEHAEAGFPNTMLWLTADTALDGSVFSGGAPVSPVGGFTAALGHLPIAADGPNCSCGQQGCLNSVAGPTALLTAAKLPARATIDDFATALAAGKPGAVAAWDGAVAHLSRAVLSTILTSGAERVVLGGILAQFAEDIAADVADRAPAVVRESLPPIVAGVLGHDGALHGAERAARSRMLAALLG